MKTIFLFRHGKSDWGQPHETDHERVLAKRGIKAAGAMGKWLTETGQTPDFLISSTATRAHTTLKLAHEAGKWDLDIHTTNRLYEASVGDYLEVIRETPAHAGSVLVAGHEPTCSMTTGMLVGGAYIRFPTAAIARIDVNTESWQEVGPSTGTLIWFVPPKFLP